MNLLGLLHSFIESKTVKTLAVSAVSGVGGSYAGVQIMIADVRDQLETEVKTRAALEQVVILQRMEMMAQIDSNQKLTALQFDHIKDGMKDLKDGLKEVLNRKK